MANKPQASASAGAAAGATSQQMVALLQQLVALQQQASTRQAAGAAPENPFGAGAGTFSPGTTPGIGPGLGGVSVGPGGSIRGFAPGRAAQNVASFAGAGGLAGPIGAAAGFAAELVSSEVSTGAAAKVAGIEASPLYSSRATQKQYQDAEKQKAMSFGDKAVEKYSDFLNWGAEDVLGLKGPRGQHVFQGGSEDRALRERQIDESLDRSTGVQERARKQTIDQLQDAARRGASLSTEYVQARLDFNARREKQATDLRIMVEGLTPKAQAGNGLANSRSAGT